ncbi:MAG: hypothetical protein ACI94Y_002916 [Maribacter sp.]|jgi:hypothetical protein
MKESVFSQNSKFLHFFNSCITNKYCVIKHIMYIYMCARQINKIKQDSILFHRSKQI